LDCQKKKKWCLKKIVMQVEFTILKPIFIHGDRLFTQKINMYKKLSHEKKKRAVLGSPEFECGLPQWAYHRGGLKKCAKRPCSDGSEAGNVHNFF
jgi:hypothetical protein